MEDGNAVLKRKRDATERDTVPSAKRSCAPPTPAAGRVATHSAEKLLLERRNGHPRDERLSFVERSHTYWLYPSAEDRRLGVNGSIVGTSVTGFLGDLFPKFQAAAIARAMVRAREFPIEERRRDYWDLPLFTENRSLSSLRASRPSTPDTEFLSLRTGAEESARVVLAHWDESGRRAADLGTRLHADIERHYNRLDVCNETTEYAHFLAYAADVEAEGWVPYRTEQCLFDQDFDLAGSVDMQFARREHMDLPAAERPVPLRASADWKRSKDVRFEGYRSECGLREAAALPNANGWKYCLQIATYAALLERHYGVKVVQREFVVFHPNNDGYRLYDVDKHARTLLSERTCDAIVEAALKRRAATVVTKV